MAMEFPRDARRWAVRAPDIANLVLIALIGLSAARLVWLVWPEPPAKVVAPSDDRSSNRSASSQKIDIDAITDTHLFGDQDAPDAKADKDKQIKAPETHLKLELTGIVADSRGKRSRALIKDPKDKQDSYKVGEKIASGVKLHAIYADRVILDRNGHYETLTLESIKKVRSMHGVERTTSADDEEPTDTVSDQVADRVGDIRKKILSDPSSASHYIRLQPARQNGNLVGYRIYPGADKSLFKKAGLHSGEIVTAINGKPLDNPAASLKQLRSLAHASSATFTLKHNGHKRTVRIKLQ